MVVVGAIVILVGAIVVFIFLNNLNLFVREQSELEKCRLSVLAKSKSKLITFGAESDVELKCKTKIEEINERDKKMVMGIMAENMRECWWKFGEGKIDFLSEYDWFGSDYRCFICSKKIFRNDVERITHEDFERFLSTKKMEGSDKAYKNYFTWGSNRNIYSEGSYDKEFSTKNGESVYAVFVGAKKTIHPENAWWGEYVVAAFGGVASPHFLKWVYVVNAEDIKERCDTLE